MRFSRSSTDIPLPDSETQTIRHFFDSIAFRYDFVNQLLSFRLDESWRKRTRDLVLDGSKNFLLDLGTGTGKLIQLFLQAKPWKRAVGLDFSSAMLEGARKNLPAGVGFVSADFHALPFMPGTFDLIVSSYTLRSVQDMPRFLKEVYDLLVPGGKTAFLCLTRPEKWIWRVLSYPYLKFYLPLIGGLMTGNSKAYQFLSSSILTFQEPVETAKMMEQTGFVAVKIHRFTVGLATLIVGEKS